MAISDVQARINVEEFDRLAALPENEDVILEYVNGEIIEVPSNPTASKVSQIISGEFYIYNRERDLGHITGEAGGYMVNGERYAPDVAFVSKAKQPQLATSGYNPNPPDLAVEVDFPSSARTGQTLRIKIANYMRAGTVVWVVTPELRTVEVWMPDQAPKLLTEDDTLDGGEVLPGFMLSVKTIFAGITLPTPTDDES